jgi:hypothetical protein
MRYFFLALFSLNLLAAQMAGINFPGNQKYQGKELILNGLGMREATWFKVDVYVGALYLENKSKSADSIIFSSGNKKLIMHFVRDVDREKVVDSYRKAFKKVIGKNDPRQLGLMEKFVSKMEEMKVGKTMTLGFHGETIELYINGNLKGSMKDKAFGQTLLKIWFGANPPNQGLKDGMLGL